jgi:hypothetical protein
MTKADITDQCCQGPMGDRVLSCWFSWIDIESVELEYISDVDDSNDYVHGKFYSCAKVAKYFYLCPPLFTTSFSLTPAKLSGSPSPCAIFQWSQRTI